jgi:hypothetical protein
MVVCSQFGHDATLLIATSLPRRAATERIQNADNCLERAMPRDEKADLMGALLDSLESITKAQKIKLCSMALAALAACFGAGCWATAKIYEHKLASTEARHDLAILELQRKFGPGSTPQLINVSVSHMGEENVPKLSEAQASDLSMSAFAKLPPQSNTDLFQPETRLTSVQKPKYFDPYANKGYRWTGYISDVRVKGGNNGLEYCVELRLDPDRKNGFSVACVFEGDIHEEMMKALVKDLVKDQKITVRGVRAESGRLLHCVLVASDAAPRTASAP